MKKISQIVAFITVFSFSSAVTAQQAQTASEVIAPLTINQPAPFTGLLLSQSAVARIIVDKESAPEERRVAVEHAVNEQKAKDDAELRSCQISAETASKSHETTTKARDNDINVLTKKLADVENKGNNAPWYFAAGIAGGVIVTALAFFVVGKAQK
jgi:hypothetical protein